VPKRRRLEPPRTQPAQGGGQWSTCNLRSGDGALAPCRQIRCDSVDAQSSRTILNASPTRERDRSPGGSPRPMACPGQRPARDAKPAPKTHSGDEAKNSGQYCAPAPADDVFDSFRAVDPNCDTGDGTLARRCKKRDGRIAQRLAPPALEILGTRKDRGALIQRQPPGKAIPRRSGASRRQA
jgi:hypothetical protein